MQLYEPVCEQTLFLCVFALCISCVRRVCASYKFVLVCNIFFACVFVSVCVCVCVCVCACVCVCVSLGEDFRLHQAKT